MSTRTKLDWNLLLTQDRLPSPVVGEEKTSPPSWLVNNRLEIERDFDRVLFAAPTRRLGDKTQVFPLEKNESVRNRLTHSHEVTSIARSIGTYLAYSTLGERILSETGWNTDANQINFFRRAIPAVLSAVGLAHDMGNPPFGHQGEEAIRSWFTLKEKKLFGEQAIEDIGIEDQGKLRADLGSIKPNHKNDFLMFEGNAQTLRTLTRLQVVKDNRGLNLTFSTLAACMKYTVGSDNVGKKSDPAQTRKVGYFSSEQPLFDRIRQATGLDHDSIRHPLTLLMEACDDIAYAVVDAEDAVKKQIVSYHDMVAWLNSNKDTSDIVTNWILDTSKKGYEKARASSLSPSELNDVSMQIFRSNAITAMVSSVLTQFNDGYDDIMTKGLSTSLLEVSTAGNFVKSMKTFDFLHAYKHRGVLELELQGHNTIHSLMDLLWRGISERKSFGDVSSERTSPFAKYAYGRISENYRRVFETESVKIAGLQSPLPIRYRELQLLCDMIAGMTDQFALDLLTELKKLNAESTTH